jgi:hypothetical protein
VNGKPIGIVTVASSVLSSIATGENAGVVKSSNETAILAAVYPNSSGPIARAWLPKKAKREKRTTTCGIKHEAVAGLFVTGD